MICNSMTVVPLGADVVETWRTGCVFVPPWIGPMVEPGVRMRKPGTNAFLNPQHPDPNSDLMTFSADGTAKQDPWYFKKRPGSQKRAFHKIETRDMAGKWRSCCCSPFVPYWPLSPIFCTTKTALNEDQYEESGRCCVLVLPIPLSETRTRIYVNGHPTNGFDGYNWFAKDGIVGIWYRDPGCAGGHPAYFAKKVG